MKTRESGMPSEEMWQGFFDPPAILRKLGLTEQCGSVLEVGCGYGTFTVPAARIAQGTVYAVDIDPAMLATTRTRTEAAELRNVELHQRDFTEDGSGLPDGSVDYVMLFNLLHADERMQILDESKRVLNSNGKLAVIHWNYDASTPRGPSMAIRPRPEECRFWAEQAGFSLHSPGLIDLPPYHYGFVFGRSG
jgi:SAM-dependent methyltransferase